MVDTNPAEKSLAQRLDEENARATQIDALIAGLDSIPKPKESLGLSEASLRFFVQTMNQLTFQEFINLPTKKGHPTATILGIDNALPSGSLSYTDKKLLRKACLDGTARRILEPAIQFMDEKRREVDFNVFGLALKQRDIIVDEERRQKLQSDLVTASVKRLELLQNVAEIKAGDQKANEMEVTRLRLTLNSEKTSVLSQMVKREFCYRTDHAAKALQQVEGFIDAAIQSYEK